MANKNEKIFKVVNVQNGGIYMIGEKKLKREVGEWEMYVETAKEATEDTKMSINDIKLALKEKGVDFKGNASREVLEGLLNGE